MGTRSLTKPILSFLDGTQVFYLHHLHWGDTPMWLTFLLVLVLFCEHKDICAPNTQGHPNNTGYCNYWDCCRLSYQNYMVRSYCLGTECFDCGTQKTKNEAGTELEAFSCWLAFPVLRGVIQAVRGISVTVGPVYILHYWSARKDVSGSAIVAGTNIGSTNCFLIGFKWGIPTWSCESHQKTVAGEDTGPSRGGMLFFWMGMIRLSIAFLCLQMSAAVSFSQGGFWQWALLTAVSQSI